jgi:hypothetical protein
MEALQFPIRKGGIFRSGQEIESLRGGVPGSALAAPHEHRRCVEPCSTHIAGPREGSPHKQTRRLTPPERKMTLSGRKLAKGRLRRAANPLIPVEAYRVRFRFMVPMKIRFLYNVEEQKKQDNLRCQEGLYDLARRAWQLILGVARIVFSSIGRRFAGSWQKIGRVVC